MPTSTRLPRIPAAARKAGATTITRCSANVFSIGVALVPDDLDAPGRGPAVRDALVRVFGAGSVSWDGRQMDAMMLTLA